MSELNDNSLHKEFDLERLILFSDAVFAIAITLLVLDIKFPELPESFTGVNIFNFFKPLYIHFFAFALSFFFIGQSWARHLQLCKFLKQYNNRVIFLNLLLLFFIVLFPFSVSAFVENVKKAHLVSMLIYIFNIVFVTFAQFLFAHYIIKKNTTLAVENLQPEKEYFYLKSKYTFIMLFSVTVIMIIVNIVSNNNLIYTVSSLDILAIFAIIINKKLKKYKPENIRKLNLLNHQNG